MIEHLRQVTINGEPQGEGVVLAVEGALYIDRAMARAGNLNCGRLLERDGRPLCAIPVLKVTEFAGRVDATVPLTAFRRSKVGEIAEPERLPEVALGDLAYFNYDISGSVIKRQLAVTDVLRGGLRLDENAFDLGGVVSRNPNISNAIGWNTSMLSAGSGATRLTITDFAYRRNWFDDRANLMIGRGGLRQRGFLSGGTFDGIGLTHDNIDNQGNPRISQSRMLTGYNASAGVLTYSIGDTVLKQIPLAAGPYTIDPTIFANLPQGGHVEIVGYDGRVTPISLPVGGTSRLVGMFKPGTWDGDVEIGRIITANGGYAAALQFGAREGLSDSVTIEAAGSFTPRSAAVNLGLDTRLPYDLGVAGLVVAVQARRLNLDLPLDSQREQGWSVAGYYEKRFGRTTIGGDYRRNGGGGILAGGYDGLVPGRSYGTYGASGLYPSLYSGISGGLTYTGSAYANVLGTQVEEDARVYISGALFDTGVSGTLTLRSISYTNQPYASRFAEAQLNGNIRRLGNWGLYARGGRDGYGQSIFSGNVFWSVPLGGSVNAALAYNTDRVGGNRTGPDRVSLTLNGSDNSRWNQADQWSLMVDNQGYGTASYNREFDTLSTFANVVRSPSGGVAGTVTARGSLALADGHLVAGKSTGNTMLVVKAPALPYEDVYYGAQTKPVTRTDGSGYAIIPNPLVYRENLVRVNDAHAPLGLDVPDRVMPGTVYPYRGYVVPVATRLLKPARLFPALPAGVVQQSPFADVDGNAVPIEPDGSLYVEDLAQVTRDIVVSWQVGDATRACTVRLATVRNAEQGKADGVVRRLDKLACDNSSPPPAESKPDAVPVEKPTPRLPYLDFAAEPAATRVASR